MAPHGKELSEDLKKKNVDPHKDGLGNKNIVLQFSFRVLTMMCEKAGRHLAAGKQTKDMDYWNHVLWSDEIKINLFGSDGVKRVWRQPGEEYKTSVSCLQSSMVVGMSWFGAA